MQRYGPGGEYWGARYHQQFGANAKPLPITSWQIWNEPNLKKYFAPNPSPGQYARLLQISYPSIKQVDPKAEVVLGGMTGRGDVSATDFLKKLYAVSGIKAYFDATALHPYMPTVDQVKTTIQQFRSRDGEPRRRRDADVDLRAGLGLRSSGQPGDQQGTQRHRRSCLTKAYKLVLANRRSWNVQRLFWYLLRDPVDPVASCSFCASAGILNPNRIRKPAYNAFKAIVSEKDAAAADDHRGPGAGKHDQRRARPPSSSPRTSRARPSSASSTPSRSSRAPLPTRRRRRSPTAITPSTCGRSMPPGTSALWSSRSFNVKTH